MKLNRLTRIRTGLRRVRNRFRSKAMILLYHRIDEMASDPQLLAVTPQRFASQMDYLTTRFTVVSLRTLVEQKGKLPDRCVVVTFDDGYADNLLRAAPILRRYHVPATVFVTSGYVDQRREFWWDELERLFLQPSTLPSKLHLEVNGWVYDRHLGDSACYSHEEFSRHRGWTVTHKIDPTARQTMYRDLCGRLRRMSERDRSAILNELLIWSGMETQVRETHRCLTSSEVQRLAAEEMIEVGAHTVSHAVLSTLSPAEQWTEICGSREQLETILAKPVTVFAYPYGTRSDYTADTAALLREAGFSAACSNFPDVITTHEDIYQLPRFIVRDWSWETFARALDRWFDGRVEGSMDGH